LILAQIEAEMKLHPVMPSTIENLYLLGILLQVEIEEI
jgi:hypothetical protein